MKPNPRHLVLNLLQAQDGGPMTARQAIASCGLFGIRENSVRVTLVRLTAAGLLAPAGRGSYRLGPKAQGLAADVATWRAAGERVRDLDGNWNGDWIAVHVGSLGRSDRVALRARDRALALAGLRELDRGFFVRPDNLVGGVAGVRSRLLTLGLDDGAAVFVARDLDPAREKRARRLWDGKALDRGYRDTARRLDAWLAKSATLAPATAARESYVLGNDAIRQLLYDPLLPAPLVDTAARAAFIDAVLRFDAAGHAIWQSLRHAEAA